MSINAKEVLKNKFWIVESDNQRVGTISLDDDNQYMLSNNTGTRFFKNVKQLSKNLGAEITWTSVSDIKKDIQHNYEVHGYPTSCAPYNPVFDVKQKIAMFTKSAKSKSLYCAGYFIIKFDKGWVKSFCPKLITVERYETRGPFKTEIEQKAMLNNVNRTN